MIGTLFPAGTIAGIVFYLKTLTCHKRGLNLVKKRLSAEDDVDRYPVNFCHFLPTNAGGNVWLNVKRFLAENIIINYH